MGHWPRPWDRGFAVPPRLDDSTAQRFLAGPVEIRLPSGMHQRWDPSVVHTMLGQTTILSIDGHERQVRIQHVRIDDDPQFLLLTLVAVD